MALKNFDLKEIIFTHCEDPAPNSNWANWWAGNEPAIPPYWAHLLYWSISEAESYFARCENFNEEKRDSYLPQYDFIKLGEDIAIQNVEVDQLELIKRFEELNVFDGQTILRPFEFESLIYDDEELRRRKYHQCMAVYSIYCADIAISGLLNHDASLTASATSYTLQSADMTYEDVLQNHFENIEANTDIPLTDAKKTKIRLVNFSALGANGAAKRHAPNNKLRAWAVELYKTKKWNSANEAAYILKDQILAHGRTIGAVISASNAQRTFAEWFNKSV